MPVNPPTPDPYDELPEAIKASVSRKEYWGMPYLERNRLIEDMTQPDDDEADDFDTFA